MTDHLSAIRSLRESRQAESSTQPLRRLARRSQPLQSFQEAAPPMAAATPIAYSAGLNAQAIPYQQGQPALQRPMKGSSLPAWEAALPVLGHTAACHFCAEPMEPELLKCPHCEAWQVQFSPQVAAVRPWVRYWARSLDLSIYNVMALWTAWQVTQHDPFNLAVGAMAFAGYGIFMNALWMLLETACLTGFGTTPGKWLFNIKLSQADGSDLTFALAFRRTLILWFKGMGMNVPIANLVTMGMAYSRLNAMHSTPWDEEHHLQVQQGRLGSLRITLAVLGLLALGMAASILLELFAGNLIQAVRYTAGAH